MWNFLQNIFVLQWNAILGTSVNWIIALGKSNNLRIDHTPSTLRETA